MLVLRRKAGEAIVLNGVITIHVLAVEGERVKLGIDAPPEVVIVRSELLGDVAGVPRSLSGSGSNWRNRDPRSSSGRYLRPVPAEPPAPDDLAAQRVPAKPETGDGTRSGEPEALIEAGIPPHGYES
jgi:carbon storage regulator